MENCLERTIDVGSASVSARGGVLRRCAACATPGATKTCSRCGIVRYCGRGARLRHLPLNEFCAIPLLLASGRHLMIALCRVAPLFVLQTARRITTRSIARSAGAIPPAGAPRRRAPRIKQLEQPMDSTFEANACALPHEREPPLLLALYGATAGNSQPFFTTPRPPHDGGSAPRLSCACHACSPKNAERR